MRSIYATSFELGDASLPDAVPFVAEWFCRDTPASDLSTDLTPGQRSHDLPQERGRLDVEVLEVDGSSMWSGTWSHPHSDDASLSLVSQATLAEIDGVVAFGLTIQVQRVREELTPLRFPFAAPRLPRVSDRALLGVGRRYSAPRTTRCSWQR